MIIQLQSATVENLATAKQELGTLARSWGQKIAETHAEAAAAAETVDTGGRGIDPVSVATLVLSIPSSVLAVADLADRIHKRRRAKELIDQAQHLAAQQTTAYLTSRSCTVELRTLDPDQLLDLLAGEDPDS